MKIALIHPINVKIQGGMLPYVIELKKKFEENGVSVDIWTFKSANIPNSKIIKSTKRGNNFEQLKEYDWVHLTSMSEDGSKRDFKEGKQSKFHDLYKFVDYSITIHGLVLDFKRRIDYNHMIDKAKYLVATSESNRIEIEKRFKKKTIKVGIPFTPFKINHTEKRNKIVCLSRFYPGKRTDEFFKLSHYFPKYEFVFKGSIFDKNGKVIGGLGAQFYYKKIEDMIKTSKNVCLLNEEKTLKEILNGAWFAVDFSHQVDKDRPQYTTLEAFSAGVIPIIHPLFSGRMRDGKEVIAAENAEEAKEKIGNINSKKMFEYGQKYLKEFINKTNTEIKKWINL